MKDFQTLDDALSNIDKPTQKPVKFYPSDENKTKRKPRVFTGNSNSKSSELKGKTFYFNNYQYVVKNINSDNNVVTTNGVEFRYDDLIAAGVKFTETEKKKPAMFIKADTDSSGNYVTSEDKSEAKDGEDDEEEKLIFVSNNKDGAANNKVRLDRDVRTIKKHYVKKVPEYSVITDQIAALEIERAQYLKDKNDHFASKCDTLISELKQTKDKIDKAFSLKPYTTEDKENRELMLKSLKENPEYVAIDTRRIQIKEDIKKYSVSHIMTTLKDKRNNLLVAERIATDEHILDLSDVVGGEKVTTIETADQELLQHANVIADLLNEYVQNISAKHKEELDELQSREYQTLSEDEIEILENPDRNLALDDLFTDYNHFSSFTILNMTPTEVRKLLNIAIGDKYRLLKEEQQIVQHELRLKKNQILQGEETVEKHLINMFNFEQPEEKDTLKSKEVIAAVYADLATRIAYNEASSKGMLHNLDEAISGAMLGLAIAIDEWYSIQTTIPTTPTDFTNILYLRCKATVSRSLLELVSSQASGSTIATIAHNQKKLLSAAKRIHPHLALLKPEVAEELILSSMDNSEQMKVYREVSESELAGVIGGDEGDSVDVWSKVGGETDIDMVEAQNYYKRVINSIGSLLEEFEVGEDKSGNLYAKTNKMFDVYDRIILMMKFGFIFDYMQHDPENKRSSREDKETGQRLEATNQEIADECIRYAQEVLHDHTKTFTSHAIGARWNKMMKTKIPMLLEYKPELEAGLKYMLVWAKQNGEALKRMSQFREEKTLIKTREELIEAHKDQLDVVGSTKLVDGRSLVDTYEASQQNNLGDDIGDMFNELMF